MRGGLKWEVVLNERWSLMRGQINRIYKDFESKMRQFMYSMMKFYQSFWGSILWLLMTWQGARSSAATMLLRKRTQALVFFNRLRPWQNGHHFPEVIFKCIFLNKNVWILIKISLKFVSAGPINNIPSLVLDNGLAPTRWQVIIWANAG